MDHPEDGGPADGVIRSYMKSLREIKRNGNGGFQRNDPPHRRENLCGTLPPTEGGPCRHSRRTIPGGRSF
jgi:hypothetical protein